MNNIIVLCVFLAICSVVKGQQRECVSVNGKRSRCIPIHDCQSLSAVVRNPNRTEQDISLLKNSHCGFKENVPNVCCPLPSNNKCYTPEGKPGKCVGLKSCRHLQKLLVPPLDKYKILYMERSKCEGSDQYSVCCGPVPDLKNVQKGKCATKLSAFPPDPATECCGVDSSIKNKIFGGNVTRIDQYPWLANIEAKKNDKFKILCIGALISSRYVVCAAHCIHGSALLSPPETIRLGEYDTKNDGPDCVEVERGGRDCTDGVTRILIQNIIPHPEHDKYLRKNDIALIRMAEEAPFTDFIRPICLTQTNVTRKTTPFKVILAGWPLFNVSSVKMHVELPFVNRSQCQVSYQVFGRRSTLLKSQICAGGETDKGVCTIGPLMYENDGTYELVGISSFGPIPCGKANIPDVFTNIYEYHPWIRSNIVP